MSDSAPRPPSPASVEAFVEDMSAVFMEAMKQNVDAQRTFADAWLSNLAATSDEEEVVSGLEGYADAYERWMQAAVEQFERMADAVEGEDVDPEEFRDLWLNTANDAFKEVMGTSAFAAATGRSVDEALELRQEVEAANERTLRSLGFATESDVSEVGERLVELERRQQSVEEKLDRLLDERER